MTDVINNKKQVADNDFANYSDLQTEEVAATTTWQEVEFSSTPGQIFIDNQTSTNNDVRVKFQNADTTYITVGAGVTRHFVPFRASSIWIQTSVGTSAVKVGYYVKGTQT